MYTQKTIEGYLDISISNIQYNKNLTKYACYS